MEDLRPVNAVTGSGFHKLMNCTAPEYTVASAMYSDTFYAKYTKTRRSCQGSPFGGPDDDT